MTHYCERQFITCQHTGFYGTDRMSLTRGPGNRDDKNRGDQGFLAGD